MKILYVKNNSERSTKFQLKTIIYEDKGQKYIKKQALSRAAIPHLKKMKENYSKLSESIIHPKLKLAKITDESHDSLTFEFIEGISLETRFNTTPKEYKQEIIHEYISLMKNAFKMTAFNQNDAHKNTYKMLFGIQNFTSLKEESCLDSISNIDLIFSNIIFTNDSIYLIDYEWVFDINLPINYLIYRALVMLDSNLNISEYITNNVLLYSKMERNFVDNYVMNEGFYFQRHSYIKINTPISKHIQQLKKDNETHKNDIQRLSKSLTYAESIVRLRDEQLQDLRIKNRLKRLVQKFIPISLFMQKDFTSNEKRIYNYTTPSLTQEIKTELIHFQSQPLISIVMPVYNVDPKWLDLALQSVEKQWYKNWELCLVDDKSTNPETVDYLKGINHPKISIKFLEKNLNISGATNAAIDISSGEYIALMDNDDEITPDALYEMVKAINKKDAEFIYSDEDFISTEGECSNPHYKPDFSPDLLLSHNYITHFTCFKKSLLNQAGPYNPDFDGAQDYDLFLRLTEHTSKIHHISKVLYHWRMLESSTSINSDVKPEALTRGKNLLETTLLRRNIDASVLNGNMHHYYRIKYDIINSPLISIIIPFKDKPELLDVCINSILEKSTYQNYEIIGISNNSEDEKIFDLMVKLEKKDSRISFYEYNVDFNYADINNHAVHTYAKGEHILLLNNDIEVIEPTWIEAMLEHSQRNTVGCVGAKLYYPNDTVQHAGIIIGLGGYAGHSHKLFPRDNYGYFNRLYTVQNLSAVTAACLMVKKSIYKEVNGMDEIRFKVAYNDVDFCLRVREKGYLNIFTPYAEMYHHESVSRGYETTPEKIARFQTEKDALYKRHKEILDNGDPYYNPNLTHATEDFSLCLK